MKRNGKDGPRPVALKVVEDAIPAELKSLARWVTWRYQWQDDKWKKVPLDARTVRWTSATDPASWASFDEAMECYRRPWIDGIGFAFAEGDPFAGVDLDHCRNPGTGALEPWARGIIAELDSFTEASPSGTGVKILVRGEMAAGSGCRRGDVEIYSRGRYFTVTGHHLEGSPEAVQSRQEALQRVHARWVGPGRPVVVVGPPATPCVLTDDEIIEKASGGKNGKKFRLLWSGDTSEFDYGSQSEADLALCGILAFYAGPDAERIDRLFAQSGMAEISKWDERPDYRLRTVLTAIQGQGGVFWTPKSPTMKTRPTKTIQDYPGPYNTDPATPGGVTAKSGDGGEEEDAVNAPEIENGEDWGQGGIALALELARTRGKAPDFEVSFELARLLRRISSDDPMRFKSAVEAFCEATGRSYREFVYAYVVAWSRVTHDENAFDWAVRLAEASPYPVPPGPTDDYAMVASIAYHLGRRTRPDPFLLPVKKIAKVIGMSVATASRMLELLQTNEIIECVDENYSFRDGKAKEYIFLGAPLEAAEDVPAMVA